MADKKKYAIRTDRWKNMTPEQKALQYARKNRWVQKNYARVLLSNTRVRATKLGLPFNLEAEDISIPEFCPVLGIRLVRNIGKPGPNSPSVDKIIPALGYVKGNIIVISYKANTIKTNATPNEILRVGDFFKRLIDGQIAPV